MELQAIGRQRPNQIDAIRGWLAPGPLTAFRDSVRASTTLWIDPTTRNLGFTRCGSAYSANDPNAEAFDHATAHAVEAVGFPRKVAMRLTAAMHELRDNVYEHSGDAETGIIAFQARPNRFDLVVSDRGQGVLQSLRKNSQFAHLSDHGIALQQSVRDGVSSRGPNTGGGFGFRDIFTGLANMNCDLRFRSGDHAMTIQGTSPDPKNAQLSQKAMIAGFIAVVTCYA
jgi:anti-sigma regulatory factor (Ser/Thr protein kinase)